jgi:hypothetical protein
MGHPRDLRSRVAADRQQPGAEELSEVSADCRGIAVADPSKSGYRFQASRIPTRFRSGLVRRGVRQRTAANTPGPRKAGFRAVGGQKLRPKLRLDATTFDATPSRPI